MRSLFSFVILAFVTLGLVACSEGEETKKEKKIRQGTQAECQAMWLALDHMDAIYRTLSKDHQDKMCENFKSQHEGLQCSRTIENTVNGKKTVTYEDMTVTNAYDCASGSRP